MMLLIYKLLWFFISPFIRIWFYARCLYGKDKWGSVQNHFGVATKARPSGRVIWIHAASVGESNAALTYIAHIKKKYPNISVVFTTITLTSAEILAPKLEKMDNVIHQFIVADHQPWVAKFLDYWDVDAAIFLESEIWPNIVSELDKRCVPIYLLNARLSQKSFTKWCTFKDTFARLLSRFTKILAQSDLDVDRYSFFYNKNIARIDNLKYSNPPLACNNTLFNLFQGIFAGKKVFVAASTHEKEEDILLQAHAILKKKFDIVTVIIPRHLTRIEDVKKTIDKYSLSFSLQSEVMAHQDCKDVYCIDAYGEVGTFFRLADITFVGGSLIPIGGHNIYEPVALGKPVLHGKYMDNALETRDFLKKFGVAFEINTAEEINEILSSMFQHPDLLKKTQEVARSVAKNLSLEQIDDFIKF